MKNHLGVFSFLIVFGLAVTTSNSAFADFRGDIKEDSNESDIEAVQEELVSLGFMDEATGVYDTITRNAVIAYQVSNNLEPTGIVDKDTYDSMFSVEEDTPEEENDNTDSDGFPLLTTGIFLDKDGLKMSISSEKAIPNYDGMAIPMSITNNTGMNINIFYADQMLVNDLKVETGIEAAEISDGSTLSEAYLGIPTGMLSRIGPMPNQIQTLTYDITASESYMTTDWDSGQVTIATSAFADINNVETNIDAVANGKEVYNKSGLRVVYLGNYIMPDTDGPAPFAAVDGIMTDMPTILLYVENNTGTGIRLSADSIAVDGVMAGSPSGYIDLGNKEKGILKIGIIADGIELDSLSNKKIKLVPYLTVGDDPANQTERSIDPFGFTTNDDYDS